MDSVSAKQTLTTDGSGSNSDVASHRIDGLIFRWIDVDAYKSSIARVTRTPELRP